MKKRKTIILTLALLGITVFSGQACPPNGDGMMPAPAPIPGPPGTDATVTAGDGVNVANGVVSLDTNFTNGLYWKLDGNTGTTAGTHFLGTTDNQPLDLHVNGERALRLEPGRAIFTFPNIIGGFEGNSVGNGAFAATIAGGGPSDPNDANTGNRVFDAYDTIGGGGGNTAGSNDGISTNDTFATVGGGLENRASQFGSTIAGGVENTASGQESTIGGGRGNVADGLQSTIGGGAFNTASETQATVAGGSGNTASGRQATVAGGVSNTASGPRSTVGGGSNNEALADGATIAGGGANTASGDRSTIAGGLANTASGERSTVGGGFGNSALADLATIAGGGLADLTDAATGNVITDDYGTIGGGGNNKVGDNDGNSTNQRFATIGGGEENEAGIRHTTIGGGLGNRALDRACTIGGGANNQAGFDFGRSTAREARGFSSSHSTVSGGQSNIADGDYSTIGGGRRNKAGDPAATVGGGSDNEATELASTVAGGRENLAIGNLATVGGGQDNVASGVGSTVPGGFDALASQYGQMAHAAGSFATAVAGDAQTSVYIMRNQTSDTTLTHLFLDGTSQRLAIAEDQTMAFDILVAARSDSGQSAGYHFRGLIKRTGVIATLVGTPTKEVLGENVAEWNATVVAFAVPPALSVFVTGSAATNIRWVATVRTTEVTFP